MCYLLQCKLAVSRSTETHVRCHQLTVGGVAVYGCLNNSMSQTEDLCMYGANEENFISVMPKYRFE